jgi:hypothetical protein
MNENKKSKMYIKKKLLVPFTPRYSRHKVSVSYFLDLSYYLFGEHLSSAFIVRGLCHPISISY